MSLLNKLFGKGMKRFYEIYCFTSNPKNYRKIGDHVVLEQPLFSIPSVVEIESFVRIQPNVKIIASRHQKVIIKKYTAIGAGSTIVPGEHTPTVSVPQYLSYLNINDVNHTLIIEEDVWIGTNATLLYKANIGRGAVVGANSLVTKKVPPYAVVAGSPARIIAVRFSLEQIVEHEQSLYPEAERLDKAYLKELFDKNYAGLKTIGYSSTSLTDEMKVMLHNEKRRLDMYE